MGSKREIYERGNLVVVWKEDAGPLIEESVVRKVYDEVFRPALQADIARLHAVMAGSLQLHNGLNFDNYWHGLMELKEAVGESALPDLSDVERALEGKHRMFTGRDLYEFRRGAMNVFRDREDTALEATEEGFMTARFNCIGYDTSAALRQIGERLTSERGRAALYIATIQGPDAVDDLLTTQWVNDRRVDDLARLRARMHDCAAMMKAAATVAEAHRTRKDEPRADDIDEARRIATIRVVAGTEGPPKHRAA